MYLMRAWPGALQFNARRMSPITAESLTLALYESLLGESRLVVERVDREPGSVLRVRLCARSD